MLNFKMTEKDKTYIVNWDGVELKLTKIYNGQPKTIEVDLPAETTVREFTEMLNRMKAMPADFWPLNESSAHPAELKLKPNLKKT